MNDFFESSTNYYTACQDGASGMMALPPKSVKLVYGSPPYPNADRNYGVWKSVDYLECERIGQEIVDALTKIRENVRQTVEKANAPKTNVVCRHCGATTTPDASGCCEYCGAPVE